MRTALAFLIIPVVLDILFGDPAKIPHPIVYIGKLINRLEKWIRNSGMDLKMGGFLLLSLTLLIVISVFSMLQFAIGKINVTLQIIFIIYFLYTSLASKCLSEEARKVHHSLLTEDIVDSRVRLSYLVGRDTTILTREEVIKGTVETVAENTIDGVLAPLMFIAFGTLLGYPLQFAFFYKAINTLDSMVGYNNEKYGQLGFASAKMDDLVNFIPARIGSIMMLISGLLLKYDFKNGLKILLRDKRNHKSPNCAYPEAVVAGLLNIQLGGTHTYFGQEVYKPTIGDSNRTVDSEDIIISTRVMYASELILLAITIVIFVLIY